MPRDLCDACAHLGGVRFQLRIHNRIQVYEPPGRRGVPSSKSICMDTQDRQDGLERCGLAYLRRMTE